MEVASLPPGVKVFERGWLSSNNILFIGDEHTALVDSGYVTHAPQTLALVESNLDGRPLDRLLNTHLHSDHCGGNAALQARYDALRTEIPPGDAEAVRRWDSGALSFEATGQLCPRFNVDGLLLPGSEQRLGDATWQVLAAPGHDPHSVILFQPDSRTLISADALWESGFGVVFPELLGEPSFEEVAHTLDLIDALRPARVIPGHGRMFTEVDASLRVARRRLEGLSANPVKHARHAVKVLIKFKLMEARAISKAEWTQWCVNTPYLKQIAHRFFDMQTPLNLAKDLLSELTAAGLAKQGEDWIEDGAG